MPAVVLEGGTIFSIRTRLRVGIRRFAILRCATGFGVFFGDEAEEELMFSLKRVW
jgi:hypothetical protein